MVQTRTLFAAVVAVLGFAGTANAQVVGITDKSFQAGGQGRPNTIAPYGTFSMPLYPNGNGPMCRVWVDYGTFLNGTFTAFNPNSPGYMNPSGSTPVNIGRGQSTAYNWAVNRLDCNLGSGDVIRARLQQSTNGGMTWTDTGSPSFLNY